MTILVPLMMFGWIPLTVVLFRQMPAHRAVIVSVIGGVLFLPAASYDMTPFPTYTKSVAIALSVLLGSHFCRPQDRKSFRLNAYDIPMLLWCFVSPLASALSNGLSLRYALGSVLTNYLNFGVVYWAGRRFFSEPSSLRELARGIVIGGLLYVPLLLFEARMSPQLSIIVFGFFPHSFAQHFRYGGWRPIVFMEHGLVLSMWMAASFTIAFWFWKTKAVWRVAGIHAGMVAAMLLVLALLTRSANAWVLVLIAIVSVSYYNATGSTAVFRLIAWAIPIYMVLRLGNVLSRDVMEGLLMRVFDDARVSSFGIRLIQEELFSLRALERPLFGWSHMGRAWPVDAYSGRPMIQMVDSLFTIVLSTKGLFGLFVVYSAMLIGPWRVFGWFNRSRKKLRDKDAGIDRTPIILSVVVVLAMIDSLMNGFVKPAYLLCAGALVTWCSSTPGLDRSRTGTMKEATS